MGPRFLEPGGVVSESQIREMNMNAVAGHNVTFSCPTEAVPPAHVTWMVNGKQLSGNNSFSKSNCRHQIYMLKYCFSDIDF